MPHNKIHIEFGKVYGCMIAVSLLPTDGSHSMWRCECSCGNITSIRAGRLIKEPKHCNRCSPKNRNVKHGLFGHPSYATWAMMKQRCENPNAVGYNNYGGRGISVCDRWHQFELFVLDMGEPPSKKHTLDRYPNKDGDYEPTNCRWATDKEQLRNTRSNRIICIDGISKNVT